MDAVRHLVVIAGADPDGVDALAAALRDDGTVRTAYSADALFESLDQEVDVVLVGDDLSDATEAVVTALAAREFAYQIGVLGAVPDESLLGPHGPVDAVLAWDPEPVREPVRRLAARADYRKHLEEYYDLAEERASRLAREESAAESMDTDRLDRQVDRIRRELAARFDRLDDTDAFDAALAHNERSLEYDSESDADTA